jgi:sigma-B regulation protein RsbU (phosphoserine phosphatase)
MRATPAECLGRSNRLLFQSTDVDRFATCFYGVLDGETHRLRYANAGHDRPLRLGRDGTWRSLDGAGLVLGILEDSGYEEDSVSLDPGESLVVYSDGIIDAADAADEAFGMERLACVLEAAHDAPVQSVLDRVFEAVNRHAAGAPQTDDMTLLVVRRSA